MSDNIKEAFSPVAVEGLHHKLGALRVPFPPEKISKKPKGGVMLDYVGHADITERLLDCDPEWNWSPCQWEDGAPKFVIGPNGRPVGFWIRLTVCGVTRFGYGSVEPNAVDAEKQLIGDALRNAAMRFGVALELWSKTERSSAATAPAQATRMERQIVPAARPQKPPQPEPKADSLLGAVEAAFDGKVMDDEVPFDVPSDGAETRNPYGIPISIPFDPQASGEVVLNFGKHKGRKLNEMVQSNEGRGYLQWMLNKIREDSHRGKMPKGTEEHILVIALANELR
jgi:hypothetical protein